MDLDWEKLVRRYVWHDERTPYFTRVANLTRRQAHYELFAYALFIGVLAGVIAVAAPSNWVSLYAFSVCCAALLLGITQHPWAAIWCACAPLAALAYWALAGFDPRIETGDRVVLIVAALAGLAYSPRIVGVARARAVAGMTRWLRLHCWAFVLGNAALNATNWYVGGDWWAFWPLIAWGLLLGLHYLVYKAKRVDQRWVDERTDDVRSKSYDRAHIDSIEKRYGGPDKRVDADQGLPRTRG